jgi:hypothetical protein
MVLLPDVEAPLLEKEGFDWYSNLSCAFHPLVASLLLQMLRQWSSGSNCIPGVTAEQSLRLLSDRLCLGEIGDVLVEGSNIKKLSYR